MRCAAKADLVKVFESSYPMCSVCNQTKVKEDSELSHFLWMSFFLHCNGMSFFEERILFCECVFCKVYVFARLLKLLTIAAF